jgi:hypothetical protein
MLQLKFKGIIEDIQLKRKIGMHYCYKGGGGQYHKEYENIVKS